MKHFNLILTLLLLSLAATFSNAAERFVDFKSGDVLLNDKEKISIYVDGNDCKE